MADAGDDPAMIKMAVLAEVKTSFRPEFVNRIDEIVVFSPLDEECTAHVWRRTVGECGQRSYGADESLRWSTGMRFQACAVSATISCHPNWSAYHCGRIAAA